MDILPEEIESIKSIGQLNGDEVKMIKTSGGFFLAVGKKKKTSRKPEVLAAGSHGAIVAHQMCKEYKRSFQPAIAKSEHEQLAKVEDKSCFLAMPLSDKGIELFVLSKNNSLDFILSKHGLTIGKYETEVSDNKLIIKNHELKTCFYPTLKKEVSEAIAGAMQEKIKELNLTISKEK